MKRHNQLNVDKYFILCGYFLYKMGVSLFSPHPKGGSDGYQQVVHKVFLKLSTNSHAGVFAFIHLSPYTTSATI